MEGGGGTHSCGTQDYQSQGVFANCTIMKYDIENAREIRKVILKTVCHNAVEDPIECNTTFPECTSRCKVL